MCCIWPRSFGEDLYGLAHITEWEPYDLHGVAVVSWGGSVLYAHADPEEDIITADTECTAVDLYDLGRGLLIC